MLVMIVAILLVIVQTVFFHPILEEVFAMVLMIVLAKVRHGATRKQVAKALCMHLYGRTPWV